MISPERSAAISILEMEVGFTDVVLKSTDELWQMIFKTTDCYAGYYRDNILNDGKPWRKIKEEIQNSGTTAELMNIYNQHPKLQKHKPFLDCLTARKKKLLKKHTV